MLVQTLVRTVLAGGLRCGLVLALFAAFAACDPPPAKSERGIRVVSLSPNTTEAIFAVGAEGVLVGRSQSCDFPPQVSRLPSVGGFADPNVEAILALQPTLVVGAQSPAGPVLEKKLLDHRLQTFFPRIRTVADIGRMITGLGERVGRRAAAAQVVGDLDARLRRLDELVKTLEPLSVVIVFDESPIVVAGPGGFIDELLQRAGGHNLIKAGGLYPSVGLERLLSLDPEVIIDATMAGRVGEESRSGLPERPGWSELGAVRRGKVRLLRSSAALRPGPRIAEGLAAVIAALHNREPPR